MSGEVQPDSPQPMNSLDCWDYSIELECIQGNQDLQLAAELGKTLLERNKELENAIKQQQNVIEDQTQEIEYLTKQTAALREVNDSRLRIYEQLEVSIQDLERDNRRLVVENSADKKHIKSLTVNVETLESKCDDLQTTIDDLRLQVDVLKRRAQRPPESPQTPTVPIRLKRVELDCDDGCAGAISKEEIVEEKESPTPVADASGQPSPDTTKPEIQDTNAAAEEVVDVEQVTQLLSQLREARAQNSKDQRRITELEEQLSTMVQQNQALENQIMQMHCKDEEMKSMHEEFTTLDEVRQGQTCSRCLRGMYRGDDTASVSVCSDPEDDDASMLEALRDTNSPQFFRSSFTLDVQECNAKTSSPNTSTSNLYRNLVQKYEALLELQRQPHRPTPKPANCLSLQEEMQLSGDFETLSTKDTDEESGHGDSLKDHHRKAGKTFSHTPTDFSEAETSSSGFADETSNKETQTDGRVGSFLCSIADGEDCLFSIYDDAESIDSRFRNRPEYRELFREIFGVLKKAAEGKEEGEQPPILDDCKGGKDPCVPPSVPPVTPAATTELPEFPDDTQSVTSEASLNDQSTTLEDITLQKDTTDTERVLKPLVREPLEYLSVSVNVRKRSSSRRKHKNNADRSDSPVTHILGSPKITYSSRPSSGRKSREFRNKNPAEAENIWNGNTLQFWSKGKGAAAAVASPNAAQGKSCFEYKPSSASQDLHKLKRLDLSYAEVLRKASSKKRK